MSTVAEYAIFEWRLSPVFAFCLNFVGSRRHTSLASVSPLNCCESVMFS
jgi:hypothetical protein